MKKFDYYIGIDVSKLTLDTTVLCERENSTKTDYYKIENTEKSIAQFVKKKLSNLKSEQIMFCFEDTGIYSLPLAYYLSGNNIAYWQVAGIEIQRSKGITRGKSDKIDSKDIALYAYVHVHKFRRSNISSNSVHQLRLLFTEREKVLKSLASFEKTSENKGFVPKDVLSSVVKINKTMVGQLKKAQKQIEAKMLAVVTSDNNLNQQYRVITSIPGVGRQTAIYLIIVTKGFETFKSWRQVACYAGVAPFPYQSGTSIQGRNKVHHFADKKLKSLLNMCAIAAIQCDKEIRTYYDRKVKDGKSKMLVINNVRCKLLSRIFAVVNRKSPFINTFKFAS
jgi:transposase